MKKEYFMAKKRKNVPIPTIGAMNAYEPPPIPDNNPDGPYPKPNDNLNGCSRYPESKMFFPGMVAKGESANAPDVQVQTADGVSNSFNDGERNLNYNFWNPIGGKWGKNRGWPGGNMSGM